MKSAASTPRWRPAIARTLKLALVWILLIVAWEGAYRAIGWRAWVFPAPSHVLDATLGMLNVRTFFGDDLHAGWPVTSASEIETPPGSSRSVLDSALVRALPISGARLAVGFAVSIGFGLAFGVALWRFDFLNSLLGPVFLGLQTLPSVCWVPLAVLTLGITETGVLFVLIMGTSFAMTIAMRDGLRTLPPIYGAAGRMLGARRARLYLYVLLPACLPALAGTLRQGFSFAWRSLLGAELILLTQRRGLGFLLNIGREFNDVAQVVAVMIVMIGVGMAIDRWVFAGIERRVRRRFGLTQAR